MKMGKKVPRKDQEKRMSLLGKGAFMSTYRKTSTGAPAGEEVCRYAVKVMDRDDMDNMGVTEEDVRREARTLAHLCHRHIVRYFGLEVTDEVVGIVMELGEGGSLAGFIKECALKGCVDSREVLVMTSQIADAMDYMHSQGVVHRDIKADNILLAHAGEGAIHIKVADFGVAVVLATVSGSSGLLSRSPGTDRYFAPERGKGQKYGRMADMWAVGCVMIELLTRERLREALWYDGVEVSGRREQLIGLVEGEDKDLGAIVRDLLHLDHHFRLNALILKSRVNIIFRDRTRISRYYTANPRCPVSGHSDHVVSVTWNNNGSKLATASWDQTVRIWAVDSGGTFQSESTLSGHSAR